MSIFYVHGFNSGVGSSSGQLLEKQLGEPVIRLDYDSAATCEENLKSLKKQLDEHSEGSCTLVGTSLGAFYAIHLAREYGTGVAFNPAFRPEADLLQFVGENTNFSTGKKYLFTREALESYRKYPLEGGRFTGTPVVVFVSRKDDLFGDRVEEVKRFFTAGNFDVREIETGHRIEDFSPYLAAIRELSTLARD